MVVMATTTTRLSRSQVPLTKRHLARLSKLAAADHETFHERRPTYRGRLVAVVLAQGGGTHYLDRINGVKDLDVWSFFALPTGETRFPEDRAKRHVDFGPSDLGRQRYNMAKARSSRELALWQRWHREHEGRRVDLMLRGLRCDPDADPAEAVREWLDQGIRKPQSSPGFLRRKGVILIDPPERRGEVIWDPPQVIGLTALTCRWPEPPVNTARATRVSPARLSQRTGPVLVASIRPPEPLAQAASSD